MKIMADDRGDSTDLAWAIGDCLIAEDTQPLT